ncbi:MAG: hypothetical protein AMXMBFR56_79850 [Polyangiaceae bacterium]
MKKALFFGAILVVACSAKDRTSAQPDGGTASGGSGGTGAAPSGGGAAGAGGATGGTSAVGGTAGTSAGGTGATGGTPSGGGSAPSGGSGGTPSGGGAPSGGGGAPSGGGAGGTVGGGGGAPSGGGGSSGCCGIACDQAGCVTWCSSKGFPAALYCASQSDCSNGLYNCKLALLMTYPTYTAGGYYETTCPNINCCACAKP